jgi:hypothetical protein
VRNFRIPIFLGIGIASVCLSTFVIAVANENDEYSRPESWLCRPGAADLCAATTSATIVAADGARTLESWKPRADAAVDCFYVYPTVSDDPNGNSTLVPGPGEKRAVAQQFAPFSSACRPYAPMYRQITLAGLSSVIRGKPIPIDAGLAYNDVLNAWKHYLRYDNHGRGVVLIGHSQGSHLLIRLIQEEIDGKKEQSLLAGALLFGFNVEVPTGADVGGTFNAVPICRSPSQVGCIVAYESFRANSPPPENSRFTHPTTPGMEVACTDPAVWSASPLEPVLAAQTNLLGEPPTASSWASFTKTLDTPFVSLPGWLQAHCVNEPTMSYLSISLLPQTAADSRPHDIPGDLVENGHRLRSWGLHLVDMNLAMGNLIDWVGRLHKSGE